MNSVLATLTIGLVLSTSIVALIRSARQRPRRLDELLSTVDGKRQLPTGRRSASLAQAIDLAGYADERAHDLFLLRIDPAAHDQRKVLTACAGGAWLTLVLAAMTIGGVAIPIWFALIGGLIGLVVGFIYPDLATRSEAEQARREFDYAVAAFLSLARTLTTGGEEPNAAFAAAATAGSGPWFEHLQRACGQARVENREVSETLGELGDKANIRVLTQVSGVLSTAYKAGTPPSDALATRTEMVLREQFHDMRVQAAERTEMMTIPTSAISLLFIVYVGLPAFIGLTSGTVGGSF